MLSLKPYIAGIIDYEEFIAATIRLNKLEQEAAYQRAFQAFDTDKSGCLSPDEIKEAMRVNNLASSKLQQLYEPEYDYIVFQCIKHSRSLNAWTGSHLWPSLNVSLCADIQNLRRRHYCCAGWIWYQQGRWNWLLRYGFIQTWQESMDQPHANWIDGQRSEVNCASNTSITPSNTTLRLFYRSFHLCMHLHNKKKPSQVWCWISKFLLQNFWQLCKPMTLKFSEQPRSSEIGQGRTKSLWTHEPGL